MSRLAARLSLFAFLALLALPACSTKPDKRLLQYLNTEGFGKRYTGNAEEEDYVTLGDNVDMQIVFAGGTEQSSHQVAIDGTILLPELGAVHVAGMTRTDIETLLTEKYSAYLDLYEIRVIISSSQKSYFVFGEVTGGGQKQFPGDLTIWEAVMSASPRPDSANLGRVKLIRADPVDPFIIYVDINEMISRGDSTYNVLVRELDIIYVPPTLVAQLGYFLDALLFPVKQVIGGLGAALFLFGGQYYGGGWGRQGFHGGQQQTFF